MHTHQPDLLRGLEAEDAEAVLALAALVPVPSGTALFELGDAADHVYVVDRGRFALTLPMQVGGRTEDVLIEEREPGEMLGWSALIPPHRFTLKATAQTDSAVLSIEGAALVDLLSSRPELGYRIARNVAEIIGRRLQMSQAMWLRQMQRVVASGKASAGAQA